MTAENLRTSAEQRIQEAQEILQTMRQCRARLNRMNFNHAASHADIAVQLTKQAIATERRAISADPEQDTESAPVERIPHDQN